MKTRILPTLALTAIGTVLAAGPADALTRNCSSAARMCVYYNSKGYGLGAEYGTDYTTPSFNPSNTSNDIYFKAGPHGSTGAGSWVWNNAAALRNAHTSVDIAMFENSNYGGLFDVVDPGNTENLVNTKNDNASLAWGYAN